MLSKALGLPLGVFPWLFDGGVPKKKVCISAPSICMHRSEELHALLDHEDSHNDVVGVRSIIEYPGVNGFWDVNFGMGCVSTLRPMIEG